MLRSWGEMRVVVGGLSGDKTSDTKYKWTWRSNWKRFMMIWLASTILSKIVVLICNIMTFNWLFITDSFFDKLPVWFQRDY